MRQAEKDRDAVAEARTLLEEQSSKIDAIHQDFSIQAASWQNNLARQQSILEGSQRETSRASADNKEKILEEMNESMQEQRKALIDFVLKERDRLSNFFNSQLKDAMEGRDHELENRDRDVESCLRRLNKLEDQSILNASGISVAAPQSSEFYPGSH